MVNYFNAFEILLWIVMGLACGLLALRKDRRRLWPACPLFFIFAATDWVELQTGAWWRPWWLLVWKASCCLGLLATAWWFSLGKQGEST